MYVNFLIVFFRSCIDGTSHVLAWCAARRTNIHMSRLFTIPLWCTYFNTGSSPYCLDGIATIHQSVQWVQICYRYCVLNDLFYHKGACSWTWNSSDLYLWQNKNTLVHNIVGILIHIPHCIITILNTGGIMFVTIWHTIHVTEYLEQCLNSCF